METTFEIATKELKRKHKENLGVIQIKDLPLNVVTKRKLEREGMHFLGEIVTKTRKELSQMPSFGEKKINEIENVLSALDLTFSPVSQKKGKRLEILENTVNIIKFFDGARAI